MWWARVLRHPGPSPFGVCPRAQVAEGSEQCDDLDMEQIVEVPSADFRNNLTDHMIKASRGRHVAVTYYRRTHVVLVDPEWYDRAVRALFNAEVNGEEV